MSEDEQGITREGNDEKSSALEEPLLTYVAVTGTVALSESDFASVWLALPHVKRLMLSLIYLIFGLSLVGWSGIFEQRHRYAIAAIVVVLGVALLVSGASKVRASFARQSLAELGTKGDVTFSFDPSGFSLRKGTREIQFDWGDALMAVECRDAFVIYTEPRAFLVIPKRAFEYYKLPDLRRMISDLVPCGQSALVSNWRQSLAKSVLLLAALWVLAKMLSF
jgi:hypothetical protein